MADTRPKLLIVEDDAGLQRQLRWAYDAYQLLIAGDREEALEIVRAENPPVVTLDLGLPPDPDGISEGMAALAQILAERPATKVIVASGHGDRASARRAVGEGAWDFYQKPLDIDTLGHIVSRAFHVHALEQENRRLAEAVPEDRRVFDGLVTAAPEMLKVARMIERVATADVAVLLLGGGGTGKGLLARALHAASGRAAGPFVAINCAAIPEALLESELFGHATGAPGRIEQAAGGTLFLDEVGDLPQALQGRLLRFLEDGVIERIGASETLVIDARVVGATHHDLEARIAAGQFREDLYYRLAEIVVRVPSLVERTGDAVLLARHFAARHACDFNPQVTGFAADALAAIDAWHWPGNVRELENRVKRALILAEGKLISAADLDLDGAADGDERLVNLRSAREEADRQAIRRAMARSDGNISNAARLLGISRPTLYDLIKSYQLQA
ncbi:MAG TPA: PEP-CTERM-box response regulator transcription factor [Sphingobium sp.]|nr:PEP-CTERM-box response regulator transcription factor [Sphingobium sp.]